MRSKQPIPGQRWVSDTEPELGLGIILKAEYGRVETYFPAATEHRHYAIESAPLRRVEFKAGDRIKTHTGESLAVDQVEDRQGLFVYHCADRQVPEAELSDSISFSKPEERLLGGQVDELSTFDLRVEALHRRNQMRQSIARGFVGGRVDLIPHQMAISAEVDRRLVPRVLLADEVGLGKTIEAGLILHRLHLTGRANRVLVLVPEPLIHQWFVELLRRFNLLFSLFDEERCASIEANDPEANPFLDSQLVLCSVDFLAGSERPMAAPTQPQRGHLQQRRWQQAVDAGWDLLIVDEAHHLEWTPEAASPQYRLVEDISAKTPGLLLLTATPQQLGPEGHFARLRLLDPERYSCLESFQEESTHYEQVAKAVDKLLAGKALSATDQKLCKSPRVRRLHKELGAGEEGAREALVSAILDEFGVGRVMFRNTRKALSGFPERKAFLAPLAQGQPIKTRILWLVELLQKLGEEKVLLICKTRELVEEIAAGLQREINLKHALFHEGLTLLQRDRNAAFFSEEDGARLLICSEIGSEGRNFQFAHHLVLFDLPENPELLEQRIGRLDRIGQTSSIHIHVPFQAKTESEVLVRWYHEGLDAFEKNLSGAAEVSKAFAKDLSGLCGKFDAKKLKALIDKTAKFHQKIAKQLQKGHDRLLELNSSRGPLASQLLQEIRSLDSKLTFEDFVIRLFDHFGVHTEELGNRSYLLLPGHLITDQFPLPAEGLSVTFDRARALSRDDLGFMSWDHPLLRAALDLMLGAERGNSSYAVWKNSGKESILLQMYLEVECVAPPALHVDRFLPKTPIRVVVDHALKDQTDEKALATAKLESGDVFRLLDKLRGKILPGMIEAAHRLANEKLAGIIADATANMESRLQAEIERLEDLAQINPNVSLEEIAAAKAQKEHLREALGNSHLRTDALRLILRLP
jgi:ATP-dependent helicase HepA